MSDSIGPCDNCGLCCEELLVEATAVDVLREPRIDLERPIHNRSPQLSVLDACWIVAGPGSPCPFLTPRKRCDIYPTRPNGCVAFAPGSPKCQELRKESGMAPVVPQPAIHQILTEIMQAVIAEETDEPGWK
jgi:Fe-S-cluster containining protein